MDRWHRGHLLLTLVDVLTQCELAEKVDQDVCPRDHLPRDPMVSLPPDGKPVLLDADLECLFGDPGQVRQRYMKQFACHVYTSWYFHTIRHLGTSWTPPGS